MLLFFSLTFSPQVTLTFLLNFFNARVYIKIGWERQWGKGERVERKIEKEKKNHGDMQSQYFLKHN